MVSCSFFRGVVFPFSPGAEMRPERGAACHAASASSEREPGARLSPKGVVGFLAVPLAPMNILWVDRMLHHLKP